MMGPVIFYVSFPKRPLDEIAISRDAQRKEVVEKVNRLLEPLAQEAMLILQEK